MKKLIISMVLSALLIIANITLLANGTYAWLTDSKSNRDNAIAAGNLAVEFKGYDSDGFEIAGSPFISVSNWQPTDQSVIFIEVKNAGSLDLKYDLAFEVTLADLAPAIWYSLSAPYATLEEAMSAAKSAETATVISNIDIETAELLNISGSKFYRLDFGMSTLAGNEYQNKSMTANINLVAYQTQDGAAKVA